jgi:hypothetical protein
MKYAVEMGSGAMMYIPSFINFRHSEVNRGGFIATQTAWRSYKPALGKYAKEEDFFT